MDWENARFPGAGGLRQRVQATYNPATVFRDLGHQFGDWIEYGRGAPPATVEAVEQRIAGYLSQAAKVGRRWGIVRGFGLGFVVGFLILVGAGIWVVIR